MVVKCYIATALLAAATLAAHCPPMGPVLPPPTIPDSYDLYTLRNSLNSLINNGSRSWNASTNSFSVMLTSAKSTFFEFHHAAKVRDQTGVKTVNGDAVYRVMSVTKIFNVLSLLLTNPYGLDTPIARYIPELHGIKNYEDVTLRMLASQASGVPRDGKKNPFIYPFTHTIEMMER